MIKRIVIIGPESTGKSTLSKQLAEHYNTLWCPEYAREYLNKNGIHYTYEDLLIIAKGQLKLEDKYVSKLSNQQKVLFIDTDMYVMKVWCEYVFQKCHPFIINQIAERKYDLYLLCNLDLPWTKDELREYPDEQPRKELFNIYKNILLNQSVPFLEISGYEKERINNAIQAVEAYI